MVLLQSCASQSISVIDWFVDSSVLHPQGPSPYGLTRHYLGEEVNITLTPLLYLMKQLVQGAIAHVLCDDAEELRLVANTKDLDDVIEPGLVEDLSLLQQTIPLPGTHLI